jgi:hypothetical protein
MRDVREPVAVKLSAGQPCTTRAGPDHATTDRHPRRNHRARKAAIVAFAVAGPWALGAAPRVASYVIEVSWRQPFSAGAFGRGAPAVADNNAIMRSGLVANPDGPAIAGP